MNKPKRQRNERSCMKSVLLTDLSPAERILLERLISDGLAWRTLGGTAGLTTQGQDMLLVLAHLGNVVFVVEDCEEVQASQETRLPYRSPADELLNFAANNAGLLKLPILGECRAVDYCLVAVEQVVSMQPHCQTNHSNEATWVKTTQQGAYGFEILLPLEQALALWIAARRAK